MDKLLLVNSRPLQTRTQPGLLTARRISDAAVPLAIALTILALLLRLYDLNRESLWLDEGYTLLFSGLSLPRVITVGGAHEHPPLYYLLVHAVMQFNGFYLVPRVLSAVVGSTSIFVLYLLGQRLYGKLSGMIAAILLALSPFHVWWSRDGRGYELAGLFVLLSYLLLFTALDCRSRRLWIGYALFSSCALYTEYTTLLVLLPQAILVSRARLRHCIGAVLVSWLLIAAVYAPWLRTLITNVRSVSGDYWIPVPNLDMVTNTVLEFLGFITPCAAYPCVGHEAFISVLSGHEFLVALVAVVMVLMVGVVSVYRRDLIRTLLVLWLVFPFLVILLLAARRSLYIDRVFLDATFPLYLLLGSVVQAAKGLRLTAVVLVPVVIAIVIGNAANTTLIYATPTNPDWKSATRDLQEVYGSGDDVVYYPGVLKSLIHAQAGSNWHPTWEWPLWTNSYLDIPGWQSRYGHDTASILNDRRLLLRLRIQRVNDLVRARELGNDMRRARRVWLVTLDYSGMSGTRRWFVNHGFRPVVSQLYSGGVRLELWSRPPLLLAGGNVTEEHAITHQWHHTSGAHVRKGVIIEVGTSWARRRFAVQPGTAYAVDFEYQAMPGSQPWVSVELYNQQGKPINGIVDRSGNALRTFPRTEWYDLPATGVWLTQPFGFIPPPDTVSARLTLGSGGGLVRWRQITVHRSR